MKIVETAILSTDLAMYFKKRNNFLELIENGEFDWQSEDKKERKWKLMMWTIYIAENSFYQSALETEKSILDCDAVAEVFHFVW